MDFNTIVDMLGNQGIWCALFLYLFYESRKDGKEREERLMGCLDSQGEQLRSITSTLERINERLVDVECKIKE